ncbi:MAG TPA: heme-binding protein [Candidatus Binataceae bacterium]|nr:heme-binding protein [Candidatus Binataceae bacterium]
MITKQSLVLDDAKRIVAAAVVEARKNEWNVTIAVVDDGGHLIYLERMDGAPKPTAVVATEKARTASLFKRPTLSFEEMLKAGRYGVLSIPGVTPLEGGVPLIVQNECLGAVGVSGVQSHQDAQVARAGAAAIGA